jgi:hypothetical protein
MTIRTAYILPPGTYTNYSTQFDSDVVLSGSYTFNGNTGIYTTTGNIETRYADITINVTNGGSSNTFLCLAANTGYVDVGNVTATGVDVILWAKGSKEDATVFVSNVRAASEYLTPKVTATRVWLYSIGLPTTWWSTANTDRRPIATSATRLTFVNPLGGSVVSDSGSGPYASYTYRTSIRGSINRTLLAQLTGSTIVSETTSTWDDFSEITAKVSPTQFISPTSLPMSRINKELGYVYPFNQSLNLNNTQLRRLANNTTSSSTIKVSDTLGKSRGYTVTPASFNISPDVIVYGYQASPGFGSLSTPNNLFSPDVGSVYTTSVANGATSDYTYVAFSLDQTSTYIGNYYIIDVETGKQLTLIHQTGYVWQTAGSVDGSNFFSNWTTGASKLFRIVPV